MLMQRRRWSLSAFLGPRRAAGSGGNGALRGGRSGRAAKKRGSGGGKRE